MKAWVRFVSLFLLILTLLKLLSSGQITLYISPRFVPLTWFAVVVLFGLAFLAFRDGVWYSGAQSFRVFRGVPWLVLLAFLSPFFFPPKELGSSLAGQKGMAQMGQGQASTGKDGEKAKAMLAGQGLIRLEEQNFLYVLDELYRLPEAYAGREVELEGFIYEDAGMEPGRYLAGRYTISCCAADAAVTGLFIEGKAPHPKDAWIRVRGKLFVSPEEGMPVLRAEGVEIAPKPENPYVFSQIVTE